MTEDRETTVGPIVNLETSPAVPSESAIGKRGPSVGWHTPGPWATHFAKAQVDAFAGGKLLPVCQLLWPTDMRGEDETYANASLIAAAPDMLAALKEIDASWTDMFPGGPDAKHADFEMCEPHLTFWRNARAAIAKAEGRDHA